MRTPYWIGIVVLALILGAVVGYALKPVKGLALAAERDSSLPRVAQRECDGPLNDTATPHREEPGTPSPVPDEQKPVSSVYDDLILQALKSIEPLETPAGDKKITGYVRTPDGAPVVGAQVIAIQQESYTWPRHPRSTSAEDPELWEYLVKHTRTHVQRELYPLINNRTATTDADGYYELAGLAEDRANLSARCPGYEIKRQRRGFIRPDAEVDWVAYRSRVVVVTVSAIGDTAPNNVRLCYKAEAVSEVTKTGKLNEPISASVGEGTWTFWATDRDNLWRSEQVELQIGSDGTSLELVLNLEPPRRLSIKVESSGGRPQQGYSVYYAKFRDDLTVEEHFDPRRRMVEDIRFRGEGLYQTGALSPGTYAVGVLDGNSLVDATRLIIEDSEAEYTFKTHCPSLSDGIRCVVEAPDGYEIRNPNFSIVLNELSNMGVQVWLLDDGSYLLIPMKPDLEDIDNIAVQLDLPNLGTGFADCSSLTAASVTLRFDEGAKVDVRITNLPDHEQSKLAISWVQPGRRKVWRHVVTRRASGTEDEPEALESLGELQPGTYEISIRLAGRISVPDLAVASVKVESGQDQVINLKLVDLYEVILEASGVEVYTWMTLNWDGAIERARHNLHMDDDGKCIIPLVPAGTYTVKYLVDRFDEREKTFTVKGNSTVYLTE